MNIVITGTTNGIGYATARALYGDDHEIIMINRDPEKAADVKIKLEKEIDSGGRIQSATADFSNLDSVMSVCSTISGRCGSIDVLINNAGLFCDSHQLTEQGLEMTLGVNYAAPVLLTRELLPLLKKSGKGRIINVCSRAALYGKIRFASFFAAKHPHGFPAYSASKLAVLLWSRSLASEHRDIDVIAVHPGEVASNIWKGDSLFMRIMAPIVRRRYQTIDEGAATTVRLAGLQDVSGLSGCFIEKLDQIVPYNKRCLDEAVRKRLLTETGQYLAGIGY